MFLSSKTNSIENDFCIPDESNIISVDESSINSADKWLCQNLKESNDNLHHKYLTTMLNELKDIIILFPSLSVLHGTYVPSFYALKLIIVRV